MNIGFQLNPEDNPEELYQRVVDGEELTQAEMAKLGIDAENWARPAAEDGVGDEAATWLEELTYHRIGKPVLNSAWRLVREARA